MMYSNCNVFRNQRVTRILLNPTSTYTRVLYLYEYARACFFLRVAIRTETRSRANPSTMIMVIEGWCFVLPHTHGSGRSDKTLKILHVHLFQIWSPRTLLRSVPCDQPWSTHNKTRSINSFFCCLLSRTYANEIQHG